MEKRMQNCIYSINPILLKKCSKKFREICWGKKNLSPKTKYHSIFGYRYFVLQKTKNSVYPKKEIFFHQTWTDCVFEQNLKGCKLTNKKIKIKFVPKEVKQIFYSIYWSLLFWHKIFNKVKFFTHCTQESTTWLKCNKILFTGHFVLDSTQFMQTNSSDNHSIWCAYYVQECEGEEKMFKASKM